MKSNIRFCFALGILLAVFTGCTVLSTELPPSEQPQTPSSSGSTQPEPPAETEDSSFTDSTGGEPLNLTAQQARALLVEAVGQPEDERYLAFAASSSDAQGTYHLFRQYTISEISLYEGHRRLERDLYRVDQQTGVIWLLDAQKTIWRRLEPAGTKPAAVTSMKATREDEDVSTPDEARARELVLGAIEPLGEREYLNIDDAGVGPQGPYYEFINYTVGLPFEDGSLQRFTKGRYRIDWDTRVTWKYDFGKSDWVIYKIPDKLAPI